MTKKKVLVVADTYHPKVDGTLRFIEEFLPRASMFEISLLVPLLGRRNVHKDVISTTFIEPSKLIKLSGYPLMKLSWRNIKKIRQAVKENDIIFIQGPALISYLAIYFGHKYDKKTVTYLHVITWELYEKFLPPLVNKLLSSIIKRASIRLYNFCDLVLVPYPGLRTELRRSGITAPVEIARLGVDISLFKPRENKRAARQKLNIDADSFVIGYVGRISKEKNIEVLVDAFKKLDIPNKLLLLVGSGEKNVIDKYKGDDQIKITGFVDNVQDYLQAMELFILPSLTETTSLSTLEAMSSGLPVIVTKVGFMKEYITRGYNGLFFPKNNPTLLALKIEKLYQNEKQRIKLGWHARRTIAYAFSWERSINKIKRIINMI